MLITEEKIVLIETERTIEEDNTTEENRIDQEADLSFIDCTHKFWAIKPYYNNEFVEGQSRCLLYYIEFHYPPPDFI